MRNRGGNLNVTITQKRKQANSSSEQSDSSYQSQSNEFASSKKSQHKRQPVVLQTIEQPSVKKSMIREPPKVPEVTIQVPEENRRRPPEPVVNKNPIIAEQNVDGRGRNRAKGNAKQNSFGLMSPQIEAKTFDSAKNNSQFVNRGEGKTIDQINRNKDKLNSSINDIKGNYQELKLIQKKAKKKDKKPRRERRNDNAFGIQFSPEKAKEVQYFLDQKQMEKEQRHRKLKNLELKEEHRRYLEEREKEMIKQKERKRKLKQLKEYSKFDSKHQEWKQTFEEKQKMAEQVVKKYQGKVGFHIRAEKKEAEKRKKKEMEQSRILQQKGQHYRPHEESQFLEHQRWHDDKVDQLMFQKNQARQEEKARIEDENCRADFWHGNSHSIVEQQINQRRKKKRQPHQKLRKMNQYKQHIKNNFAPRTFQHRSLDPPKQQRQSNSHREVRRYRYFKGYAVGQVKEDLPKPKTDAEAKKIGDNYLEYVRCLPKKMNESQNEEEMDLQPEDIQILQKKFNNNVGRMKKVVPSIYDDGRKKKTAIQVVKNVKRDELQMMVLQLQATDSKLKNKQKLLNHNEFGNVENIQGEQKQINQGFVQNIERKLALLAQL